MNSNDPGPGTLQILVERANIFLSQPLKPFIELDLLDRRFRTKPGSGRHPSWGEVFEVPREKEGAIEFKLYDKGTISSSLKGSGAIRLRQVLSEGFEKAVHKAFYSGREVAEVFIELRFSLFTEPFAIKKLSDSRRQQVFGPYLMPSSNLAVSDIAFEDQIYRSASGKQCVFNARIPPNDTRVAVKITYCVTQQEFRRVQCEVAALRQIRHPNVCKTYANLLDTKFGTLNSLIVMEKIEGGDLFRHIERKAKRNRPWSELELTRHFAGLISAFAALQEQGIVHSDIKPQNIVMTPYGELKVIDFGISLISYSEFFATTSTLMVGGTVPYFSPLQLKAYISFVSGKNPKGKVRHNPFKSDVFSLGLTFYHMASLQCPSGLNDLDGDLQQTILHAVNALQYGCNIKNLILQMLCVDEANRPDFLMLKNFFSQL